MLTVLADIYTPFLALFCLYYLRFVFNNKLALRFLWAYIYVYTFAFIESYFGWWASMGADFSSHTASVAVIVCALLGARYKIGAYACISLFGYGMLMHHLHYHTWFDVLTTMLVCSPCFLLFKTFNYKQTE